MATKEKDLENMRFCETNLNCQGEITNRCHRATAVYDLQIDFWIRVRLEKKWGVRRRASWYGGTRSCAELGPRLYVSAKRTHRFCEIFSV